MSASGRRGTGPAARVPRLLALAALALFVGACAHSPSVLPPRSPDLLIESDLTRYRGASAFEAVRELRPAWLNDRGGSIDVAAMQEPGRADRGVRGPRGIKVYIDGVIAQEGLDRLRSLPVGHIRQMRHLAPPDATFRYGIDHGAGAILVMTESG